MVGPGGDIWMYSYFILFTFSMFMDGDWYDECGQQVGYKGPNRGYGGDALNFLLVPPNLQR
jgi:hypothetical protein